MAIPNNSSDDGYVDMSPSGGRHVVMSPAQSMSSVTSGTPSTDLRFAEYPLEKVPSYFHPSEEDERNTAERPARAYSVGSRPDTYKCRTRVDSTKIIEMARDRAYSCGSKAKKVVRVLPPHHNHTGPKSSSAPILSNSRLLGSHSSIGPMEDLMEMDFSRRPWRNANANYNNRAPPPGYMDMRPGSHEKIKNTGNHNDIGPYMDMRGGSSPAKPNSIALHSENQPNRNGDYLDMEGKNRRNNVKPSTSPMTHSISPMSNHPPNTSYMDMNFNKKTARDMHLDAYSISPTKSSLPSSSR